MKSNFLLFIMIFLVPFFCPQAKNLSGEASLHFDGHSTGQDFGGTLSPESFGATLQDGGTRGRILSIPKIEIRIRDMKTGNKKRDRKMYDMFQANRFPVLNASLERLSLHALKGSGAKFPIRLKIRDIEKEIEVKLKKFEERGEQLLLEITFPVSLKEYGLTAPSALFGMIRVKDRVDVSGTIELKSAEIQSPVPPEIIKAKSGRQ